jgi:cytochrome c oxidase cbb3-type subunit I/II
MIRPFRHEVLRYNDYSRLEESLLDRPFQWGSKRTGPDLARLGGKYDNLWHYLHMTDPRSTSPGSNMPGYEHLKSKTLDPQLITGRMRALRRLGTPYGDEDLELAVARYESQAQLIADDLQGKEMIVAPDSRLVALLAYLQRLGRGPQPLAPEPPVDSALIGPGGTGAAAPANPTAGVAR